MAPPPPRLSGLPTAALREHARVHEDGGIGLREWIVQAGKVHRAAVELDGRGATEQAYVEYMKAASILDIILRHRDFAVARAEKNSAYAAYQEMAKEVMHSITRTRELGAMIDSRSASSSSSPSLPDSSHPRSPPGDGSGGFSGAGARPVSGSLASRIKSLEEAGLSDAAVSAGAPFAAGSSNRRPSIAPLEPQQTQPRRPLPVPPPLQSPKHPPPQVHALPTTGSSTAPRDGSPKLSFAATAAEIDSTVRSGSAPPELQPDPGPRLPIPPSSLSKNDAPAPPNGASSDVEAVLRSLRSPSEFARDFPDLDSFEHSPGFPTLPAVPKAPPQAPQAEKKERPPLPPPPAAFDRKTGALNNDTSLGAVLDDEDPSPPPFSEAVVNGALDQPPAYPDFSPSRASPNVSPKQTYSKPSPVPRQSKPPIPENSRPRDSMSSAGSRTSIAAHAPPSTTSALARRGSAPPPLPQGNAVLASVLVNYFRNAAELRYDTRVLFLDVRPREAFEARRIKCKDIVCLEPVVLRPGKRAAEIEDALVLSPPNEKRLFEARGGFEYVVVYDQNSTQVPMATPYASGNPMEDDKARSLFTLFNAIGGDDFDKPLRRQPLLLIGGLDAWVKAVGAGGIVGKGTSEGVRDSISSVGSQAASTRNGRTPLRDMAQNRQLDERRTSAPDALAGRNEGSVNGEVKKQNRQARVDERNSGGATIARSIADLTLSRSASGEGSQAYFNRPLSGASGYQSPHGIASPPIAMPQQSFQRPGPQPPLHAQPPMPEAYTSVPLQPTGSGGSRRDLMQEPGYIGYVPPRRPVDYPTLGRPEPSSTMNGTTVQMPTPKLPPPAAAPAGGASGGLYNRSAYYGPGSTSGQPMVNGYHPQSGPPAPSAMAYTHQPKGQMMVTAAGNEIFFSTSFEDGTVATTGLKNLGNTCYMNSTLQCLSATVPLARFFKDGSYRKCLNRVNPLGTKGVLAEAVAELIRVLWSAQYTFVSPITFREAICRFASSFRGNDQHDAQEFLTFLLDGVHEDLNLVLRKPKAMELTPQREAELESLPTQIASQVEWEISKRRDNSVIVELFQGQYRSRLQCMTCGTTSTTYNTFNTLTLPIPTGRGINKVTLDQCIQFFMREEIMEKDNAWQCPKCKAPRKATKRLTLARLPPCLIVHLKRFSFKGPFSDKLETLVQYPLYGLDLTNYVPPPLPPSAQNLYPNTPSSKYPSQPRAQVYDLYGVTNHFGSLSSGHYTAFVRSARDWFSIGDSRTSKADDPSVQSARSAYVLYYRRRD